MKQCDISLAHINMYTDTDVFFSCCLESHIAALQWRSFPVTSRRHDLVADFRFPGFYNLFAPSSELVPEP